VLELFEYWGEQGDGMEVVVPHVLDITRELTLMVISFAGMCFHTWTCPDLSSSTKGFGMKSTWRDGEYPPPNHKMVRINTIESRSASERPSSPLSTHSALHGRV